MNKAGGKQEIKCSICGIGHPTIKCYKNPNRMQASSAEVVNSANGDDYDAKNEMQAAQARSDNYLHKGRGSSNGPGRISPQDEVGKVTHEHRNGEHSGGVSRDV